MRWPGSATPPRPARPSAASRWPALKARLAERVKGIEDLQHRVQVQREAAVLLAQRIEVLSTKSWRTPRRPPMRCVPTSRVAGAGRPAWSPTPTGPASIRVPAAAGSLAQPVQVVWDAFQSALAQALPRMPPTPRPRCRPCPCGPTNCAPRAAVRARRRPPRPQARSGRPKVDEVVRAAKLAGTAVPWQGARASSSRKPLKATARPAPVPRAALRAVLKEHGKMVDAPLEVPRARRGWWQPASSKAGSAGAPTRSVKTWSPRPKACSSAPKARPSAAARCRRRCAPARAVEAGRPGRRTQPCAVEALRRSLQRSPQGGRGLARQGQADAAEHRAHRVALIEEVKAWAAEHADASDLKAHNRICTSSPTAGAMAAT
jgi:ATP-dependent RNA helicase SUPV3L1/SUV3